MFSFDRKFFFSYFFGVFNSCYWTSYNIVHKWKSMHITDGCDAAVCKVFEYRVRWIWKILSYLSSRYNDKKKLGTKTYELNGRSMRRYCNAATFQYEEQWFVVAAKHVDDVWSRTYFCTVSGVCVETINCVACLVEILLICQSFVIFRRPQMINNWNQILWPKRTNFLHKSSSKFKTIFLLSTFKNNFSEVSNIFIIVYQN